jgi:acyl-CoA synthetase
MSLDSNRGQSSRLLVEELRSRGVPIEHHLTLPRHLGPGAQVVVDGRLFPTSGIERSIGTIDARRWGPNELFMINSTSGTTGLPKMVTQFQNRWFYYHQLVNRAIELGEDDVFMSLVPAPFGFGLWTAHFVPTISGLPVVVMDQFTPEGALDLIERHRVTIMACVSTQFIMMLNSPRSRATSFGSLRAIFTGGEAVPYNRAAEFEEVTGAKVLQFYGSNETGAYSFTKATDSRDDRLSTCGRSIPEMNPILVDERGLEITSSGGPGQPACRGPACCAGYYNDPEGNAALYTPTGWMLMEDIVTMDDRGFVRLTGRASDFIIRGGKNISAVSVETSVGTHPSVAMVTAIPVPDEVFGERVGVFVELRAESSLTLEELAAYLVDLGVSREGIPEHLFIVDELPRSPGGKIAKGELRAEVLRARQT